VTTYRKQEQEPARDEIVEVAPNILRMQLPIQMPGLGHVNMYALVDDRGIAVVDPGLPGPFTWKAINDRFGSAGLKVADVHTVVVTHSHPDHYGCAGRIVRETGGDLVSHAAFPEWWGGGSSEHDAAREAERSDRDDDVWAASVHPTSAEDPAATAGGRPHGDASTAGASGEAAPRARHDPWSRPVPWGGSRMRPPLRARLIRRAARLGMRNLFVPPRPNRRLDDGDVVKLAGREFIAVYTPGHTIDHLCLLDPVEGVLLSGDHVLPTITPHISGIGAGPDPLRDFIASLDRVASFDTVRAVLPAHGHPFHDLPGRVDSIKRHHDERMSKIRVAGAEMGQGTVEEFSHHLFRPQVWGAAAESETYAHLEHLRLAGEATVEERNGKLVYTVARAS
jgi:glyoxylase-like metal-dependent hydrolase (beta-lactamase superfamily II)